MRAGDKDGKKEPQWKGKERRGKEGKVTFPSSALKRSTTTAIVVVELGDEDEEATFCHISPALLLGN